MLFSPSKSKLGIDIGTSSIKVVQLKQEAGGTYFLETYGMVNVAYQTPGVIEVDVIAETAKILQELVARSKVSTKRAVASLPNNIVFVSMIEMPEMSERELKAAIEWEARRYVPLPLEEVTLSWSVLREPAAATNQTNQLKILLTAVPTTVIDNYLKMFRLAGLRPLALEIEALALIRSLVGSRPESFLIIDIGARNTSLNLVDRGFLRVSRNLPLGGESITSGIAQSLHVSYARAEQFKQDLGLSGGLDQIPQSMKSVMDSIKNETSQLLKIYESGGREIQEIFLAGAGAYLPGVVNYFSNLGPRVSLGDPLKFISYDPQLRAPLSRVSQGLAVALGLAMRT